MVELCFNSVSIGVGATSSTGSFFMVHLGFSKNDSEPRGPDQACNMITFLLFTDFRRKKQFKQVIDDEDIIFNLIKHPIQIQRFYGSAFAGTNKNSITAFRHLSNYWANS